MAFEYYLPINVKALTDSELKAKVKEHLGRRATIYSRLVSDFPVSGFINHPDKNDNHEDAFCFKSNDEKEKIWVKYSSLELLLIGPFYSEIPRAFLNK